MRRLVHRGAEDEPSPPWRPLCHASRLVSRVRFPAHLVRRVQHQAPGQRPGDHAIGVTEPRIRSLSRAPRRGGSPGQTLRSIRGPRAATPEGHQAVSCCEPRQPDAATGDPEDGAGAVWGQQPDRGAMAVRAGRPSRRRRGRGHPGRLRGSAPPQPVITTEGRRSQGASRSRNVSVRGCNHGRASYPSTRRSM